MSMLTRLKLAFLVIGMLSFAPLLQAGDIEYNSSAAFNAATMGSKSISFMAPCSTCFLDYTLYTDSGTGTVFSMATSFINLTGKDYYGPGVYPADFLVESAPASAVANLLTVTSPAGYNAIGFELGSFNGGPFVVTLSDGSTFTINPAVFNGLDFFGFSSTSGISSISFSIPANDTFVIDEADIAHLTSTPEPSSLILFGTSLLGLAPFRRKLFGP
jgi:hypothetical protein